MSQITRPQLKLKRLHRSQGLWIAAVVVVAMAAAGCSSSSPSATGTAAPTATTAAPTATTAAPSPTTAAPSPTTAAPSPTTAASSSPSAKFTTFGDGTYTVGKTVEAGTYRAPGPGSNCYWERLQGFGGSIDDIIANNNTGDPSVVTIAPTDKGFQTSGCGTWTSDLSQITKSKTSFGPGTYIVKTDIDPGTYSAPGGDTCYWARLSGFGGTLSEILANGNPTGSVVVTIAASDKGFESKGCGTFTKS
jgi:hypothetical protein